MQRKILKLGFKRWNTLAAKCNRNVMLRSNLPICRKFIYLAVLTYEYVSYFRHQSSVMSPKTRLSTLRVKSD